MVRSTTGRDLRRWQRLRLGLLALGGLLLGHDAVFATAFAPGPALDRAMGVLGHGGWWPTFTSLALAGLAAVAGLALARLVLAALKARGLGPARSAAAYATAGRSYGEELWSLWLAVFLLVVAGFLIQETIEHVVAFGHLAGLGPLTGDEGPLALPVLAAVTFVLAALGAMVRWETRRLNARLAAASGKRPGRHPLGQRPQPAWALVGALRATAWTLLRQDAGRAPPRSAAA